MDEYHRQTYLDALGLEQYVPRWLLPLAPEPRACVRPPVVPAREAESREQPESSSRADLSPSSQPQAESRPQPQAQAAMRQLEEGFRTASEPGLETPEGPTEALPGQDQPHETPEPFSLSIWRSPLPLLVLDARQPRAAMPTGRLAANLLGAIARFSGWSLAKDQVWEESFAWPSVHNPAVPLSAADARAELEAWLEADLGQQPVRHLLLMGEPAARHLLPRGQSYTDCLWQTIQLADFSPPALVAPSLLELLRDPTLKRRLWLALQAVLPLLVRQGS